MIHEGIKSSFSLDTDQTKIQKYNGELEGKVLVKFLMQTHVQNIHLCLVPDKFWNQMFTSLYKISRFLHKNKQVSPLLDLT